jgi:hypothetical protein
MDLNPRLATMGTLFQGFILHFNLDFEPSKQEMSHLSPDLSLEKTVSTTKVVCWIRGLECEIND